MWPFSARKTGLNHMEFVGDGDDVDAVQIVETEFGITITNPEAEAILSVYDLFKLAWSRIPDTDKRGEFLELTVWHQLCAVLRSINGYAGMIDLETTFFAEHAKARKHHG